MDKLLSFAKKEVLTSVISGLRCLECLAKLKKLQKVRGLCNVCADANKENIAPVYTQKSLIKHEETKGNPSKFWSETIKLNAGERSEMATIKN